MEGGGGDGKQQMEVCIDTSYSGLSGVMALSGNELLWEKRATVPSLRIAISDMSRVTTRKASSWKFSSHKLS